MKITITIDTANAAFDGDRESRQPAEVARILAGVAQRFDSDGPYEGSVFDLNGNTVGEVTVEGNDLNP